MSVPVVYSTSDKFVVPTITSCYSLIKNFKGSELKIVVLHSKVSQKNIDKILGLNKLTRDGLKLNVEVVDVNNYPVDLEILRERCGWAFAQDFDIETFFDLFLSLIIKEPAAVLINSDTIILDDIQSLLSLKMSDKEYVAGCHHFHDVNRTYNNWLGIRESHYINVGVTRWNLDSIRKYKVIDKFIDILNSIELKSFDQDAINIICYHNIKNIPIEYNLGTRLRNFYYKNDPRYQMEYTKEELDEAFSHPIVYHYSGRKKPWDISGQGDYCDNINGKTSLEIYLNYLKQTLDCGLISSEDYQIWKGQ